MLSRIAASTTASLHRRRNGNNAAAAALSSALDVLPPLQWERLFSSSSSSSSSNGETPSGSGGGEPSTSASNADDSSSNKEKKKEKPRTRIRKPPRAVAGSWETCAELDDFFASDAAHRVPAGANLYDLRSTFPYHFDDSRRNVPLFAAVAEAAAESGVDLEAEDEDDGKHEGRKRIVEWETNAVLETVAAEVGGGGGGGGISQSQHQHPMNRKVGLRVHLADLAAETGLSDAGARWVALIAGPRYDPRTGKLRLTDERHATRRENARSCARMLSALVAEGKRKHPS